ncbi:hypothetical protein NLJ89_g7172 [Agrocybe chaxingu]|uniref:Cytochrome P450 n=1 Tax=Agrocybe chaxingu TaxID=84603 RepID=A0A9W8JXU3_9AGAR|nr:hypothetical protein NLJ89_g7172 [Agrocybe chaxingu]
MDSPNSVLSAFAGLAIFFVLKKLLDTLLGAKKYGRPYPPGPPPKFLIGNALDLPLKDSAKHFREVGKELDSDLVFLTALGNHVLFINKREIADELLERRSKIYSSRTQIPTTTIMGWDKHNVAMMDYGEEWRLNRKACQQHLNRRHARAYEPVQLRQVHKMLDNLLRAPEDFFKHNEILSIAITMDIMYGYQVDSLEDPAVIAAAKNVALAIPLLMPGGALMNIFPILKHVPSWVPGAMARKRAEECAFWNNELIRIPLEHVKTRVGSGTARPSVISDMLRRKDTVGVSEQEERVLSNMAYTAYSAASDTTMSATGTFIHMMLTHPEVQKKAQAEIDMVVGTSRLPTFDDRASLPYVEAVYREVMRYNPPLSIGVAHASAEDDYYNGYFIPKGTTIFANLWAMAHDEEKYREPDTFNPERFFTENGELNGDSRVLAYGFGRRACVGKHVASATMWITIASILSDFNIDKAKDEFGNEIEIDHGYEDLGMIIHKKPFKCSILPRSDLVSKLVKEALSEGK